MFSLNQKDLTKNRYSFEIMHANCKIVRLLSSVVVCPPPSPGPLAENADLAERCCCWSHSIIFTAGRGSVQGGDVVIINQVTCRYEDTWHVWSMRLHSTSIHLVEHGYQFSSGYLLTAPLCHCPWLPCKGSCWTEAGLSYWHMALWSLGVRGAAVPPAPSIMFHSSRDTSSLGNRHTIKYGKSCKNHLVLESKLMNNIDA